jgi:hypothetical protein
LAVAVEPVVIVEIQEQVEAVVLPPLEQLEQPEQQTLEAEQVVVTYITLFQLLLVQQAVLVIVALLIGLREKNNG